MKARKNTHNAKISNTGKLRIIGGQWRGRQFTFPEVEGLRPTGDRIRETLFNWLSGYVAESRCLDLFAGSGAMSLEALSRGAASVTALELDRSAAKMIQSFANDLGANNIEVINTNTLEWIAKDNSAEPFDIVFIDPPFAAEMVSQSVALLLRGGWLHSDSWIYIEADRRLPKPELPTGVIEHRFKEAGQVSYGLYYLE